MTCKGDGWGWVWSDIDVPRRERTQQSEPEIFWSGQSCSSEPKKIVFPKNVQREKNRRLKTRVTGAGVSSWRPAGKNQTTFSQRSSSPPDRRVVANGYLETFFPLLPSSSYASLASPSPRWGQPTAALHAIDRSFGAPSGFPLPTPSVRYSVSSTPGSTTSGFLPAPHPLLS